MLTIRHEIGRATIVVRGLDGFLDDTRAIAAVEFGLIGAMFVLFLCFWIELGLSLFMQTALDRAVRKESRLIRTGAIASNGQTTFASNLCADMQGLVNCANLQVNVAAASTFAALSGAVPTNSANRMTTTGFNTGTSGQDVLVQVGYTRALYTPIVSSVFGKGGNVLIYSAIAFQNEPF